MRSERSCRSLGSWALLCGLLGVLPTQGAADDSLCRFEFELVSPADFPELKHRNGASPRRHLPETMGSGVAWIDFDRDGWLDLFFIQSGPFPGGTPVRHELLRNLGNGRFIQAEPGVLPPLVGYGQGAVAVDFDGDGWEDLLVTQFGQDRLLRNVESRFVDVTESAGLDSGGWSSSAAFADYDLDGDLDLYIARYLKYDPDEDLFCGDPDSGERTYCDPSLYEGEQDLFFEQVAPGKFVDRTQAAGLLPADGKGLGVVFVDLNDDAYPDLYVANDLTTNFLFLNRKDGTFEDASLFSGAAVNRDGSAEAGMGIALGDVNQDLTPDLVVTNFDVETNTLYLNRGRAEFDDQSARSGIGAASFNLLGFGTVLEDFDLDGDLDLYVANGHIALQPKRSAVSYRQPDSLLLGDGSGAFAPAACGEIFTRAEVGRGVAKADFDNDGDVDLAVSQNGGPLWLLRNTLRSPNWVGIELVGEGGNTGQIGARLRLAADASPQGAQSAWVTAGSSYLSSHDKRHRFALNDAAAPWSLEVRWPDGRQTAHELSESRRYVRVRPDGSLAYETSALPFTVPNDAPARSTDAPASLIRSPLLLIAGALVALALMAFYLMRRRGAA